MASKKSKILMVYIEPTPYIVGLINTLMPICESQLDILFLGENRSQNWQISENKNWIILPEDKIERFKIIFRLLSKGQYRMIHTAGWGEPLCMLFIILAKLFRIKVTVETDTPIPHKLKLWKRAIKRLIYPILFSFVNLFLPGGTRQAKYLEHYAVQPKRIFPVNMTVDVASIKETVHGFKLDDRQRIRSHFNISEKDIVFLFVGRLEDYKGIMDLISAFSQIKNEHATFLIVGDGSLREQIKSAVCINKKICYLGRLIGKELIEIYFASDTLILPSHFEPWGLVVNEAMAVGRPVIVSDRVGCIDDLVIHQKTGWIYEAENIKELQTAIEYFIANPDNRINMGVQSAKIIEDWTLENEAKNICQAWYRLINLETGVL